MQDVSQMSTEELFALLGQQPPASRPEPTAAPSPAPRPRPAAAAPTPAPVMADMGVSDLGGAITGDDTPEQIAAKMRASGAPESEITSMMTDLQNPAGVNPDLAAMTNEELKALLADGAPATTPFGMSRENAVNLADMGQIAPETLKKGMWVRHGDEVWQLPSDAIQGSPGANMERVQNGVFIDRPSLGRSAEAFTTAFSEQIPLADEAVAAVGGLLSGRSFEDMRRQQMLSRATLNDTNPIARDVGGVAGALAPALIPVGGLLAGGSRLSQVGRAAGLGAGTGALLGFGNTDGGLEERAVGAGVSALAGAGTAGLLQRLSSGAATRGARTAAEPASAARVLSAAGVDLTPGQMMGGAVRRVEDASTSFPFFGDAIRARQRTGIEQVNRAAYNDVLSDVGQTLPDDINLGRDAFRETSRRVGEAYDNALQTVQVDPSQGFDQAVAAVRAMPTIQSVQGQVTDLVDDFASRFTTNLDGPAWKQLESDLVAAIRQADAGAATQPTNRFISERLQILRDGMNASLQAADPFAAADKAAADAAFAKLVRIQEATTGAGTAAREGVFTPADFNRAVRSGDRSRRRGQYARGDALMQELSDAAVQALPSTVPDSGTPIRSLLTSVPAFATGAGASAVGVPVVGPLAAVGAGLLGLGSAAYSRPAIGLLNTAYRASAPGSTDQALAGILGSAAPRSPLLQQGILQYLLNRPGDDQALLRAQ
jgi:hypothetical protein